MSVKKFRLEKGWSQEHLAEISGLSTRTIQRIERGQKAGLESLKCLAAVFEVNISDLIKEDPMNNGETSQSALDARAEEEALEYVANLKGFHISWMAYVIIIPAMYLFNVFVTPGYMWVYWPMALWAFAIFLQAAIVFGLFGVLGGGWEQKHFEKRLNRNRWHR